MQKTHLPTQVHFFSHVGFNVNFLHGHGGLGLVALRTCSLSNHICMLCFFFFMHISCVSVCMFMFVDLDEFFFPFFCFELLLNN